MTALSFLALLAWAVTPRALPGPPHPATAPPGLHVELRTVGNKTTFRLSETIPLEITFRSSKPDTYAIELADGWNVAPEYDRFVIEPSDGVIDRVNIPPFVRGIVCCRSSRPYLRSAPSAYPYELTDSVRFTVPGDYQIQYTTRRVFKSAAMGYEKPSGFTVRSNVITVRIVEDDPQWLTDAVRNSLDRKGGYPSVREFNEFFAPPPSGSLRRQLPSPAVARWLADSRKLHMLDTPDAIRERVARLRMPSVKEWRRDEAFNSYSPIENSVAASSRPDLVVAALAERASMPDFGVMRGYFDLWVDVLTEQQHPELLRLLPETEKRDSKRYAEYRRAIARDLLETVRHLAEQKTGVSAEITNATIRAVEHSFK